MRLYTSNGLLKFQFDTANDLWIALEEEHANEALCWWERKLGKEGDHSFKPEYNFAEGIMELRKV